MHFEISKFLLAWKTLAIPNKTRTSFVHNRRSKTSFEQRKETKVQVKICTSKVYLRLQAPVTLVGFCFVLADSNGQSTESDPQSTRETNPTYDGWP